MKYTKYLINGKIFDFSSLEKKRFPYRIITIPMGIILSFLGLCFLGSLMPLTIFYDEYRTLKYLYIKKFLKNKNYYK